MEKTPFHHTQSGLSQPSHPSHLLDPFSTQSSLLSFPLPSYPLLPTYSLHSSPPPRPLSFCHLVHGQITELAASIHSSIALMSSDIENHSCFNFLTQACIAYCTVFFRIFGIFILCCVKMICYLSFLQRCLLSG